MKNNMKNSKTLEKHVARVFVNPFYAIQINSLFMRTNGVLRSKKQWISTNEKLIDEMGKKEWLKLLLEALEGKHLGK